MVSGTHPFELFRLMKAFAVAIVVIHFPSFSLAQEQVIDLNKVDKLIDNWTNLHNEKNIAALEKLYADEVVFYAQKLPKVSCIGTKAARLRSGKYFHQEIL